MRYDEIDGCEDTLEEALKDCSEWLKARRKRNAKSTVVFVDFSYDEWLEANVTTESPDDIISALFEASLYNKRIVRLGHYLNGITIVVRDARFPVRSEFNTEKTNIDLHVMETILSWFS